MAKPAVGLHTNFMQACRSNIKLIILKLPVGLDSPFAEAC